MPEQLSRRSFVRTGALAAAAPFLAAPAVITSGGTLPVVISSANGNTFKNGGPRTCVAEAFERIARGEDVVAALVAGVSIVELDPEEITVGYGGMPNADGVVQLDASCMHGGKRRAGAVACLEGVRTPAAVARAVMENTDHHLLVGRDAQTFARQMGFTIEADLNTERSRKLWLDWKRRVDPQHWLDPDKRAAAGDAARTAARAAAGDAARNAMVREGLLDAVKMYGTLHCSAVTGQGVVGAVTTTSGLAFKIPGRVGDSPILGAGNYADHDVGAAGSTGRGEANLYGLSSYLIVEEMRRGRSPKDACVEALRRILAATVEKRLLDATGRPAFQIKFYALNLRGEHAGMCLWGNSPGEYAVCTAAGPRMVPMEALLEGGPTPAA